MGDQWTSEFWGVTSRTFNDNHIHYDINENELLTIIRGINKFKVFLLPKPFIIETDNT